MVANRSIHASSDRRWRAIGSLSLAGCVMFFVATSLLVRATAQAPKRPAGKAAKTADAWSRQVSWTWKGEELRTGLKALSEGRAGLWLDRRVDPNQKVDISVPDVALRHSLPRLADEVRAQFLPVSDDFGAIVPRGQKSRLAGALALRRQESQDLPASAKGPWLQAAPVKIEMLDEPRSLATEWVKSAGWKLANPDAIPHDLWAEFSGPSLPLVDRLTLLLFGFDMTFTLDAKAKTVRVEPLPVVIKYRAKYKIQGAVAKVAAELREGFPEADIKVEGGQIVVVATSEMHDRMAPALTSDKPLAGVKTKAGEKRFTLKVPNQPALAVVQTVAKQLELELDVSKETEEILLKRVTFEADQATLDDLLKMALEPIGLRHRLVDKKLTVEPKP